MSEKPPIVSRGLTVEKVFEGQKYKLASYQREYTWTRAEVKALLVDLNSRYYQQWRRLQHEDALKSLMRNERPVLATDAPTSVRNLIKRFQDIEDEFPYTLRDEALERFVEWLLYRVCLVGIEAENKTRGWEIFETTNDRGIRLGPMDLLKSHLIGQVAATRQRAEATVAVHEWIRVNNEHNGIPFHMAAVLASLRPEDDKVEFHEKARLVGSYLDLLYVRRMVNRRAMRIDSLTPEVLNLILDLRGCVSVEQVRRTLAAKVAGLKDDFRGVRRFTLSPDSRAQVRYLPARITDFAQMGIGRPSSLPAYLDTGNHDIEHVVPVQFAPAPAAVVAVKPMVTTPNTDAIRRLITMGKLRANETIVGKVEATEHDATVQADGTILIHGELFPDITTAANFLREKQTRGWDFWKVRRDKAWVSLGKLRRGA